MDVLDEAVRVAPAPSLRPHIAWYSRYRQAGIAPGLHRGLPSPYLTLIFTLDDPLDLARHVDPARPGGLYRTLLGGLHTAPALVRHEGRQSGIQVALRPLGARALLGLPAGALAQSDDDAALVLPRAEEIQARLREAPTWPHRFAALDALRIRGAADLPDRHAVPGEIGHAWTRVLDSGGRLRIRDLARDVGWSVRHLTDRFGAETGLTPKAAARVVRFDRARRALSCRAAAGRPRLATIAAETGYFDQSHLVREFHALAGCSPTRWLEQECRNVQAGRLPTPEGSTP